MRFTQPSDRASLLAALFAAAILCTGAYAHQAPPASGSTGEARLGEIHFPTSARSEEAQAHFLRGVAALHSFSYDLALAEFRRATEIEPDFMMGYWGEAMGHNHPLWGRQDTEAARRVLANIQDTPRLTPRERAYLQAVKTLYGAGDPVGRDKAYAGAMEKVYREYPDDLEAACLYALALLGSARPDEPTGLRTRMRAGAIALEVTRKEPSHPGATHYILHAFDDPDHAILALPAARRYPEIASGAPHALHMPSHIFLQLGMWPEAASTQEKQWAQQTDLPLNKRDYHSLYWLLYVYLQQGRYREAEGLLALMQKSLAEGPKDDREFLGYGTFIYSSMAAAFVVDTARWDWATKLIDPLQRDAARFIKAVEDNPGPYQAFARYVRALWLYTRGMAAAQTNSPDAQRSIDELRAMERGVGAAELPGTGVSLSKVLEIQRMQIAAAASASGGKPGEAVKNMEQAAALEGSVPPVPGPPPLIKPSHELFGEILLQANRPVDAERQFRTALFRQTNRARSVLGTARAAARQGHLGDATSAYDKFLRQWQSGDRELPELEEAQNFLKQVNAR
jgi:tetratricopeptide (TPR) repeat protein